MTPDQAFEALKNILAQSTIPVPWAQTHSLLTLVEAGLQERTSLRAALEPAQGEATEPEARTLPFPRATEAFGQTLD